MILSGTNLANSLSATTSIGSEFAPGNALTNDVNEQWIAPANNVTAEILTIDLIQSQDGEEIGTVRIWNCIGLANADGIGVLQYRIGTTGEWVTLFEGTLRGTYLFVVGESSATQLQLRMRLTDSDAGAEFSLGHVSVSKYVKPLFNPDIPLHWEYVDPSQVRESVGSVPSTSIYRIYAYGYLKWTELPEESALELRAFYYRNGMHQPFFMTFDENNDERHWTSWFVRFQSGLKFTASEVDGRYKLNVNWRENN